MIEYIHQTKDNPSPKWSVLYRVPTASYKSYNLTHCPIFVLYLGEAAYTAGTLRVLQWICSVHCMALQVHSTSVWECFRLCDVLPQMHTQEGSLTPTTS